MKWYKPNDGRNIKIEIVNIKKTVWEYIKDNIYLALLMIIIPILIYYIII